MSDGTIITHEDALRQAQRNWLKATAKYLVFAVRPLYADGVSEELKTEALTRAFGGLDLALAWVFACDDEADAYERVAMGGVMRLLGDALNQAADKVDGQGGDA